MDASGLLNVLQVLADQKVAGRNATLAAANARDLQDPNDRRARNRLASKRCREKLTLRPQITLARYCQEQIRETLCLLPKVLYWRAYFLKTGKSTLSRLPDRDGRVLVLVLVLVL
ncbi:hypothetical protein AAVH_35067 [Aphelenchoides avenae]|nr:hypothetical protein AAVH_35067 [Aphelenchus avenae]